MSSRNPEGARSGTAEEQNDKRSRVNKCLNGHELFGSSEPLSREKVDERLAISHSWSVRPTLGDSVRYTSRYSIERTEPQRLWPLQETGHDAIELLNVGWTFASPPTRAYRDSGRSARYGAFVAGRTFIGNDESE
jgi:hypothetical protein